ncbi:hypothetical protein B0H14DRAFT_2619673 [Mycena olivaceomarginata]|nr:hypothetical protein B0H14DRAFT_2619673 [Mycena olivaceomarginata]
MYPLQTPTYQVEDVAGGRILATMAMATTERMRTLRRDHGCVPPGPNAFVIGFVLLFYLSTLPAKPTGKSMCAKEVLKTSRTDWAGLFTSLLNLDVEWSDVQQLNRRLNPSAITDNIHRRSPCLNAFEFASPFNASVPIRWRFWYTVKIPKTKNVALGITAFRSHADPPRLRSATFVYSLAVPNLGPLKFNMIRTRTGNWRACSPWAGPGRNGTEMHEEARILVRRVVLKNQFSVELTDLSLGLFGLLDLKLYMSDWKPDPVPDVLLAADNSMSSVTPTENQGNAFISVVDFAPGFDANIQRPMHVANV